MRGRVLLDHTTALRCDVCATRVRLSVCVTLYIYNSFILIAIAASHWRTSETCLGDPGVHVRRTAKSWGRSDTPPSAVPICAYCA